MFTVGSGGGDPGVPPGTVTGAQTLLGVIVSFSVGAGLLILGGGPIGFVGGAAVMMYMFSQPALGVMYLIPFEFAVPMIGILVIVAVIVWLK